MSVARSSRSSTVKQRGAAMSSRQMAPKVGAKRETVRTISSVSCVSRQIGNASTPAKVLKSTALPSMIGSAAWGPRFPRLRTFEPSVTTAMVLPRQVYSNEVTGSLWMARQGSATPGV